MTFIKYDKYPGKLGLEHSPVGLWNFEDNLNDSSGNGFDLSGTPLGYSIQANDFQYGMLFSGILSRASRDALTAITGALTLEVVGYFRFPASGALEYICSTGNSNEAEADNVNYSWYIDSSGQQNILWEYGAGNNVSVSSSSNILLVGSPSFMAVTRSADNPARRVSRTQN